MHGLFTSPFLASSFEKEDENSNCIPRGFLDLPWASCCGGFVVKTHFVGLVNYWVTTHTHVWHVYGKRWVLRLTAPPFLFLLLYCACEQNRSKKRPSEMTDFAQPPYIHAYYTLRPPAHQDCNFFHPRITRVKIGSYPFLLPFGYLMMMNLTVTFQFPESKLFILGIVNF